MTLMYISYKCKKANAIGQNYAEIFGQNILALSLYWDRSFGQSLAYAKILASMTVSI